MKKEGHPKYGTVTVTCACGESFITRSTKDEIRLEVCSKCHPFFTGKQKLMDTSGRVQKFMKKYQKPAVEYIKKKEAPAEKENPTPEDKGAEE